MIMGAKPDHTEPMFLKLGLLKFVDINKYLIAVFMHRYHIARTPDVFIDYFKRITDVHHYATRSCCGLHAMQIKTDLDKTSISYIWPIIWNKILSVGIKPGTSECVFSKPLKTCIKLIYSKPIMLVFSMYSTQIMRHYPYEYTLWYNSAQAVKCDIYLKLWSYAQNCLICTLHPLYCEKKLCIRYGAHKPVRVSCSLCHVCYEWYHIVFLCWICIECISSEPLWKMYLRGNKHFLNLNLKKREII